MHLLKKSKFYSDHIVKKFNNDTESPNIGNKRKRGMSPSKNQENQVPNVKKKPTASENKRVLKEIVSNKVR